jgi:lysozyme
MKVSEKGRALITHWEGDKLRAYRDGGGVWTVGRGHTGKDVFPGMEITEEESLRLFDLDCADHDITPFLDGCATTQNQFDAMTCLAFNIGLEHFHTSTVLRRHKIGSYAGAGNAFLLWDKRQRQVVQGLLNRRKQERALYLGVA